MRTAWIISEGSPGHISQSAGLAAALKEKIPLTVQTLECRPRLNGVMRSIVRAWMGRQGKPLSRTRLEKWLHVQPLPAIDAKPDLIISSGGKSVFAGRSLAALTGAPYVFLGERKPYRSEWFHTVFTPSALEQGANDVLIEMIPTQITRARVERAAAEWAERPSGRIWAMILGGKSASHTYTAADWDALGIGMTRTAKEHGIRWVLTTSRRTGGEAEKHLRAALSPDLLAKAVWWSENPEKKVAAFLGTAEAVFVTQDSVTMVTEAVASARPVFVLRPASINFPARSFLPAYFENLEQGNRIKRMSMSDFAQANISTSGFSPRERAVTEELADRLLTRLGWGLPKTP